MKCESSNTQQNEHSFIPHNQLTLGKEEENAALAVIRSGWLAKGIEVDKFEAEFCDFLGLPIGHAVAVSSGTAALYLALWSLNAQNKFIAIPSYVCSALKNSIAMANGNEIIIDSKNENPNINLNLLENAQADLAIIPHLYGIPQPITNLPNKINIIEDCAQALGSKVNNVHAGLQGDIGIFSFYATKLITSGGQGGMIVSQNKAVINQIKDYLLFDKREDQKYRFNFQMTDIQAAIGRVQLRKLPHLIERREEIFQRYKRAGLSLLDAPSGTTPVRYRAIVVSEKQLEVIQALKKKNINAVIPLKASELSGATDQLSHAFSWTQKTISLPIYPTLTNDEVDKISEIVIKALSI